VSSKPRLRRSGVSDAGAGSWGLPRPWLILNPPVRPPDHPTPLPAGVATRERLRADLIHIVAARLLAADDLSGTLDGIGVVDAFALVADPEHGGSSLVKDTGAGQRGRPPRLRGLNGLLASVQDEATR
jgi:hypothetical protein